jgi:hypothetical protein
MSRSTVIRGQPHNFVTSSTAIGELSVLSHGTAPLAGAELLPKVGTLGGPVFQ